MANKAVKYTRYNTLQTELRNEFCTWFVHQNNTDLPQEKIDTFEEIKGWFVEDSWSRKLDELKQYLEEHNAFPPMINHNKLSYWVYKQRENRKNKQLTKDKINKLDAIKGWTWETNEDLRWLERCEDLIQFVIEKNKLPLVKNAKLSNWLNTQRKNYRNNLLSKDQIKKLESTHKFNTLIWKSNRDIWWLEKYEDLIQFVIEKNKLPRSGNKIFAQWMMIQKKHYQNNSLSEEKIQKLESINGWSWTVRKTELPTDSH